MRIHSPHGAVKLFMVLNLPGGITELLRNRDGIQCMWPHYIKSDTISK